MLSMLAAVFPAVMWVVKKFIPSFLPKLLDYLIARKEISTSKEIKMVDLMIAQVDTAIAEGNARKEYLFLLMETWWFQTIVGLVFASIAAYTIMVFVDSIAQEFLQWDYNVQKVPEPFDQLLLWFWMLITLRFTFFRG
jgi:hypothetical protein